MKHIFTIYFLLAVFPAHATHIPIGAQKIIAAYPQVVGYKDGEIIFDDGSSMVYCDGKEKSWQEQLDDADLSDQMSIAYIPGSIDREWRKNYDPGRIRCTEFFKKIYGASKEAVRQQLVTIDWFEQPLRVTQVNDIDKRLVRIARKLRKYKKYLHPSAGVFRWRVIAGSDRLSPHSFAIALDINTQYASYWLWDLNRCVRNSFLSMPSRKKTYRGFFGWDAVGVTRTLTRTAASLSNEPCTIPADALRKIVTTFEQCGFIWGGRWYHYDMMHFEYRPELLIRVQKQ